MITPGGDTGGDTGGSTGVTPSNSPVFQRNPRFTPGNIDFVQIGQEARALDDQSTRFFVAPAQYQQTSGTPGNSVLATNNTQGQQFDLPSVSTIKSRMDAFLKKNRITIRPEVINSSDIPSKVLRDRDAVSPGGRIIGYTDTDGNPFIVADNVRNQDELEQAIFDETFHAGLSKVLGPSYSRELRRIIKNRGEIPGLLDFAERFDPDFRLRYSGLVSAVQRNPQDTAARFQLVEEVINSSLGHPDADRTLRQPMQRIGQMLKDFVRKAFPSFREQVISDYELFKLARKATQADGTARFTEPEGTTRFFMGAVGSTAFTRDASGNVRGIGKEGAIPKPTYLEQGRDFNQKVSDKAAGYIANGGPGQGTLRRWFRESSGWNWFREKFYNTNVGSIDFDRDIQKNTDPGFTDRSFDAVAAAQDYLAKRPLLQSIVNNTINEVDRFVTFQPGSDITTYLNRAKDMVLRRQLSDGSTLYEKEKSLEDGLRALNQSLGPRVKRKEAIASANSYIVALTTEKRNDRMWYRKGAQSQMTKEDVAEHQKLVRSVDTDPSNWQSVVDFVDERAQRPDDFVASGYTDEQAATIIQEIESSPQAAAYGAVRDALYSIRDATNEINQQNGRWSTSYQNRIDALDWQDTYITLGGQAEIENQGIDSLYDSALDAEYNIVQGRDTFPDALGSTVAKAQKAYEYLAANDVAAKVAMNVAAFRESEEFQRADRRKIFSGRMQEYNVNSNRFKQLMLKPDPSRVIYFNPDNANLPADQQSALVIKLGNDNGIKAVKGERSATADAIERNLRKIKIPQMTAFMGSLKTFRNVAFLPFELVRTTLTYGYNIGTDQDFNAIAQFAAQLMQPGYLGDVVTFSKLLAQREVGRLNDFVSQAGPNSIAAQLSEFVELGGRSNFLDSIRLDPLDGIPGVKVSNAALKKVDEFFEAWNNVTDMVGRFAYYQVKVQRGTAKEVAAAQALNLANFGARGTFSGPLGGLYAFFKATVSGAVGQIDQALNGDNLGGMMALGAGLGAVLYIGALTMSGENEEGENIVAKMNGKRFVRDFSFNIFEEDGRMPLGFGAMPVAISTGMQLMRASMGHQSLAQTADNIATSAKDNASVVPTSGIGVLSNPVGFMFDTMFPSLARPGYQVLANLNGLGFEVFTGGWDETYSARTGTRGGLSEDLSIWLQESFGSVPVLNNIASINPDIVNHLGQQYLGSLWQAVNAVHELTEEAIDPDHEFTPREGLYPFIQFFGPERFTQTSEDFYNVRNHVLERKQLIDKAGDANRPIEYIRQLESDPEYRRALPYIEQVEKEMESISKRYKERIWDTRSTPSSQEGAYMDWWKDRYRVMTQMNSRFERLGLYQ